MTCSVSGACSLALGFLMSGMIWDHLGLTQSSVVTFEFVDLQPVAGSCPTHEQFIIGAI